MRGSSFWKVPWELVVYKISLEGMLSTEDYLVSICLLKTYCGPSIFRTFYIWKAFWESPWGRPIEVLLLVNTLRFYKRSPNAFPSLKDPFNDLFLFLCRVFKNLLCLFTILQPFTMFSMNTYFFWNPHSNPLHVAVLW